MCYRVIYENWKMYCYQNYPRGVVRYREYERSEEMKQKHKKILDQWTIMYSTISFEWTVKIIRLWCWKYDAFVKIMKQIFIIRIHNKAKGFGNCEKTAAIWAIGILNNKPINFNQSIYDRIINIITKT